MPNLKTLKKKGFKYICGVDEAGRGPLAGPLSLSFFIISIKDHNKVLGRLRKLGLNDSKKIKEEKRENLFDLIRHSSDLIRHSSAGWNPSLKNKKHGSRVKPACRRGRPGTTCGGVFYNSMISASIIDEKGISRSYQILIKRLLKKVKSTFDVGLEEIYFFLDGSIKFPEYISHEVVIKGDSKIPTIMAASITAKVLRDRKMRKMGKKYPEYGFETHKGYATLKHRKAIQKYGLMEEHRKTFCRAFTK